MCFTADAASSFRTGLTSSPERITSLPCTVYCRLSNTEYHGSITSWWRTWIASSASEFPIALDDYFFSGTGVAAEPLLASSATHAAKSDTQNRFVKLFPANCFMAFPLFGPPKLIGMRIARRSIARGTNASARFLRIDPAIRLQEWTWINARARSALPLARRRFRRAGLVRQLLYG